jgi:hypothetical protein
VFSICLGYTMAFQPSKTITMSRMTSATGRLYTLAKPRQSFCLQPLHSSKKNLSAAERERRDEENRRRARKDDAIPGKTSAMPGAKDFALDPKATEIEYLRQASKVEQEIYLYTEKGLKSLKMVRPLLQLSRLHKQNNSLPITVLFNLGYLMLLL